jgi:hypothetical protein
VAVVRADGPRAGVLVRAHEVPSSLWEFRY